VNWEQALGSKAELINTALDLLLPRASAYPSPIHEAMRYSTFAGGKRLRGAFVIAVAEILGTDGERVLPAAAALEMIHTYSLIHDDLPAMDDDDYRRGKPTCHKVYGEAVAILAGDALLTLAFCTLSRLQEKGFEPGVVLRVIQEVGKAAGSQGLIGGQAVDLDSEGVKVSKETLEYIHNHKTGALFSASVRCGALLSGAGDEELQALSEYAKGFGLAFQITDDLLDLTGDQELLGKKPGSDLAKNKATFPGILGIGEAIKLAEDQVKKCQLSIARFGPRADFLRGAANYLLTRKR
jgi:geranylgeranyl diphosphate synthase type II